MKRIPILIALLCSVVGIANADEMVSLKVGYQMLKPSGQFAGTINGVGTHLDMKNDLNFKNSNQPTGEIALQFGDSRLSLGFIPMNFKGSGNLTRNINFNGQTFTAGTTVTSQLKGDIYDLGYTYYVINMDDAPSRFQLGIEGAVKFINARASIAGGGASRSVSATVPIPTLGVRARIALADFIGLVGRVGYLGYANNRFLDADAQVEFSPLPTVGIYGGYRSLQLKVDKSGLFIDTRFQGPYIGGFIRF
ncbi:MAG TPA: hypothetical protein VJ998_11545 [Pseudomonadales bacterium]|nr:hypothetical protein [Pseudomonadales bacterium]